MLTRRELAKSIAAIPALPPCVEAAKPFHTFAVRGGTIVDSFNFPTEQWERGLKEAARNMRQFAAAFRAYQSRQQRHDLRESLDS